MRKLKIHDQLLQYSCVTHLGQENHFVEDGDEEDEGYCTSSMGYWSEPIVTSVLTLFPLGYFSTDSP